MARIMVALALGLALGVAAQAQAPPPEMVKAKLYLSHDKIRAGSAFQVAVVAKVMVGYHIYSSDPKAPLPTKLQVSAVKDFTFGKPVWPATKKLNLAGEKVAAYDGEIVIRIPVKAARSAKAGKRTIAVTLEALPCGETSCYAPVEQKLKVVAPVVSARTKAKLINRKYFPGLRASSPDSSGGEASGSTSVIEKLPALIERAGRPGQFALAFIFGLIVAFMPCVYPLVPVTVAFFAAQRQSGKPVAMCLVYVLGIAVTYSAIGGISAAIGGILGGALRYPVVLWSVAAVIVLLALSMFGLFQLRVPSFIADRAGGKSGLAGALVMGLLMGVVAAPCGAGLVTPVISLAAASGSIPFGIAIFFVFSIGLGLPYMVLGLSSYALSRAPNAGPWMVTIERLFAFVLLAVALYIVRPLLPEVAVRAGSAAIIFAAGVYLAASGKPSPARRPLRLAIGVLLAVAGIAAAPWHGVPEPEPAAEIAWVKYSPGVLEQAAADDKPVIMDFGAEWCLYCKKLDETTFRDPEVVELSRSFVAVRVDLTKKGLPELEQLSKAMKIGSLPTVAFLDRAGKEIERLRITDYVRPPEMLRRMREAANP